MENNDQDNDHANFTIFQTTLNSLNHDYHDEAEFLQAVLVPYTNIFNQQNVSQGETFKKQLEAELIRFIHDQDEQLDYFLIHKNISFLLKTKNYDGWPDELEPEAFSIFLRWLQFNFCLQKIHLSQPYQRANAALKILSQQQTHSSFTAAFQYTRAILNGIGIANVLLGWPPMAIAGLLGFFGIILSPLSAAIIGTFFCVSSLALGGILIRTFLKKYNREDSDLLDNIQKAINKINYYAILEARYKKNNYRLQHEYILLCDKLRHPPLTDLIQSDEQNQEPSLFNYSKLKLTIKETSLWLDPLTSFFGSVGTVWGLPATALGIFGISLLIGVSFSPVGLALAASALLFSGIFAISTFLFAKNTVQIRNTYQAIKSNLSIFKNNIEVARTQSRELELAIAALKITLNEEILAKQNAEAASSLKKEINSIEADAHPKYVKSNVDLEVSATSSTMKTSPQLRFFGNSFLGKDNQLHQQNGIPIKTPSIRSFG